MDTWQHTKRPRNRIFRSSLSTVEKLMLIAYIDSWRDERGIASVGTKELVRFTSASQSTIARARKRLREAGIIEHIEGGKGRAEVVRVHLDGLDVADVEPLPHNYEPVESDPDVDVPPPQWMVSGRREVGESSPYTSIINNESGSDSGKRKRKIGTPIKDSFDEANRIRSKKLPNSQPLKWGTWSDQWRSAYRRAGGMDRLLKAWRVLWFHQDFDWWRKTPAHPHATWMRSKHLPTFLQAADDWDEPDHSKAMVSLVTLEDTSTPGLALMWVRAHSELKAMPDEQREEFLDVRVTHPANVLAVMRGAK
jgi:hypothetical protein